MAQKDHKIGSVLLCKIGTCLKMLLFRFYLIKNAYFCIFIFYAILRNTFENRHSLVLLIYLYSFLNSKNRVRISIPRVSVNFVLIA